MKKGTINIATPNQTEEQELFSLSSEEIYTKSHQLKEKLQVSEFNKPFIVWMQLPSRMNDPNFTGG